MAEEGMEVDSLAVRCERVFQTAGVFKAWKKESPCVAARLRRKPDRTSPAGLAWARSLAGAGGQGAECWQGTEAAVLECSKRLTRAL